MDFTHNYIVELQIYKGWAFATTGVRELSFFETLKLLFFIDFTDHITFIRHMEGSRELRINDYLITPHDVLQHIDEPLCIYEVLVNVSSSRNNAKFDRLVFFISIK